ncbi:redox-sensitive transcriptional activator SoxR [Marinospirillum minutulum]|uniref:redox-sensitive transcriptional activator SoxR n=1 Tax=Marinospirillum minutulum TaxID=64974 RepID=UPI000422AEB1|nr:redox-sensitive transcriptional activator SoxR [Marinospirillum minutulum]
MVNGNRILSIGEVAKRSGVAISTIHFYESKGLITSTRNASNHRQYPSVVLRYIAIIRVAQRTGMTLEEIQKTLSAYQAGAKLNENEWKTLAAEWQAGINQRIKRLERLRDELDNCIGCGCLSLKECPLRNPKDKLAEKGPGPQILERP